MVGADAARSLATSLVHPACPQIVTLAQTCIIALMLAWLYSDMSQSYAGIQDETG